MNKLPLTIQSKQLYHANTFYRNISETFYLLTIPLLMLRMILIIRKIYLIHAKLHQVAQPAITFSKLTIETLERGVEYVQS